MLNLRVLASLALVGLGIGVMYWIGDIPGLLIGSLFFIAALSLWTLPSSVFHRNQGRLDRSQQRISNVLLGVGVGMLGGLASAIFLPPPWFWVASLAIVIAVGVWWFRQP
jgi:hypothetical protein